MANTYVTKEFIKKTSDDNDRFILGSSQDYISVTDPITSSATTLKSSLSNLKTNVTTYLKDNLVFGSSNNTVGNTSTAVGLVPNISSTATASATKNYLDNSGKWSKPVGTTYADATTAARGLMTTAQVNKLNNCTTGLFSTNTTTIGLVPGSNSAGASKFLNGNRQWIAVPDFTPATSSVAGVAGLVPATSTTQASDLINGSSVSRYCLSAKGWSALPYASASTAGLMTTAQADKLNNCTTGIFTSATSSTNGTKGLVPAPAIVTSNLYTDTSVSSYWLNGNGNWAEIPIATTAYDGLMSKEWTNRRIAYNGTSTATLASHTNYELAHIDNIVVKANEVKYFRMHAQTAVQPSQEGRLGGFFIVATGTGSEFYQGYWRYHRLVTTAGYQLQSCTYIARIAPSYDTDLRIAVLYWNDTTFNIDNDASLLVVQELPYI